MQPRIIVRVVLSWMVLFFKFVPRESETMKKVVLFSAFVIICLLRCAPAEYEVPNAENQALGLKYFDAMIKGDVATMTDLVADNFMQVGPGTKDSVARPAMLVNWKLAWEQDYTSMSYDRYAILTKTVKEGRVAGDWVLDWGKLTMNYKNGKPSITVWYHSAMRIKNGKIERQRIFFDVADLLTQQGFTITPPSWDAGEEIKK